jgi:hypothetical protein
LLTALSWLSVEGKNKNKLTDADANVTTVAAKKS